MTKDVVEEDANVQIIGASVDDLFLTFSEVVATAKVPEMPIKV